MTQAEIYRKQHDNYVKRVYPLFLKGLQAQILPVIHFIKLNNNVNPPLDTLVDPNIMITPIQRAYETIGTTAASREYYGIRASEKAVLGFFVDVWRKIFYDYSTKYAYDIKNDLAETTKREIRTALSESYDKNLNADQTASYIRKKVSGQISRSRATLISRTETTTAAALGKDSGARSWLAEQDQKGYKEWIHNDDQNDPRPVHEALQGSIIPIDDDFDIGGELAKLPGSVNLSASQRCNCSCTISYMSERRYLHMLEEQRQGLGI